MIAYQITVTLKKNAFPCLKDENGRRNNGLPDEMMDQFCSGSDEFHRFRKGCQFLVYAVTEKELLVTVFTYDVLKEEDVVSYLKALGIPYKNWKMEEISINTAIRNARIADRKRFIDDDNVILEKFRLNDLSFHFQEYLLHIDKSREDYMKRAGDLLSTSLQEELCRIYDGTRFDTFLGHPVHYIVVADDRAVRVEFAEILMQALIAVGRLPSKRYFVLDLDYEDSSSNMTNIYGISGKSTIVLDCDDYDFDDGQFAKRNASIIRNSADYCRQNQREVLTILTLPTGSDKVKEAFMSRADCCTFVEIHQDVAFGEEAKRYLEVKAETYHIDANESLLSKIDNPEKGFTPSNLDNIFFDWLSRTLKEDLYTQYANLSAAKEHIVKSEAKGDAYTELKNMIGLGGVKEMIDTIIQYNKAQKLFEAKGLTGVKASMHMVFAGNPGTAKTTVARLFAQIMKDNGILEKGDLIEVGRADLIGQFVGWTAPMIKEKFKAAKGSILFIDEAYSLVDGKKGYYGDEAINTIVQEMENHRDDTIVIFAGYSDEMKEFLERNPGMSSRIAYHVDFTDYTPDELYQIAEHQAEKLGVHLGDSCRERLINIFAIASRSQDFGNGRFVRNLMEQAKMHMAVRMMQGDPSAIQTKDDLIVLAEDFLYAPPAEKPTAPRIGFSM